MKNFVPGERFEERGNPMRWFWLLMAALWLMQTILRAVDSEFSGVFILHAICAVLCLLNFLLNTHYLLIVEESGITWRYALSRTHQLRWDEISRVVDRENGTFTRSAGLYVYPAARPDKALFMGPRSELLPIVKRYLPIAIEFEG